jgi:hypothetical protein
VSHLYIALLAGPSQLQPVKKKEIPMNKRKERRKKKEKGKSQRTFRYYVNKIGKGFTTQVSLDATFKMMHKLLKT